MGQVKCPYVGFTEGIVFAPEGDSYFEQLLFHFHHGIMIAQRVGQRLSHQKKTFLIFSGELARELLKKVIRTRTILRAGPDLVRTRTISKAVL